MLVPMEGRVFAAHLHFSYRGRDVSLRVGLLGGGRLAAALAQRLSRTSGSGGLLVWSRRGRVGSRAPALLEPPLTWCAGWEDVLAAADDLFIAMPLAPMAATMRRSLVAQRFRGIVYCASADADIRLLYTLFPRGSAVRFMPFLLPGRADIPCLVLRHEGVDERLWETQERGLRRMGPLDVVSDEASFGRLWLLGSPWPAAVCHCVAKSLRVLGVQEGVRTELAGLGRRLFWRGLAALADAALAEDGGLECKAAIAAPGGVTEQGLRESARTVEEMEQLLRLMVARQAELARRGEERVSQLRGGNE